jgi:hypothetical protein
MWINAGDLCHWCGEKVDPMKRAPKTGKHAFCSNAHKMAHARAFAKWLKRCVTPTSGPGDDQAQLLDGKGNAKKSAGGATSSPAIRACRIQKSNAKRRR